MHPNSPFARELTTLGPELLDLDTTQRAERGSIGWCAAEVTRLQGSLCLAAGQAGCEAAAEAMYRQALDLAARQGALSCELRAARRLEPG